MAKLKASERALLRRLGSIGGKKSAKNMTAEQRQERGRKGAKERWDRVRAKEAADSSTTAEAS